ncbi:MAG: phytoene synthase [Porticoccus sp.]|jgi:phytoene synthase
MRNYSGVMRQHGKTFFWATWFLEKKTAGHLYAIYAFCRRIDDLIDNAPAGDRFYEDFYSIANAWEKDKFSGAFDEFKGMEKSILPREAIIREFLKGQASDIAYSQPKNIDELLVYCYQVAGAVGLMICDVIGIKDHQLKYFAIDLGVAMQLTNICRDIREDAEIERIYLPKNMINLPLESFKNPSNSDARKIDDVRNLLLSYADRYYESGEKGIMHLPLKTARAIMIAAKLYQAIGKKIISNKIPHQSSRVYLNKAEKILITIKVILQWKKKKIINNHNKDLHRPLAVLPDVHIE